MPAKGSGAILGTYHWPLLRLFFLGGQMNLTINGEHRDCTSDTVFELLQQLDIDPSRVAVELNQDILPKIEYSTTRLQDGDALEIVHFVGGG
jgi:thiamine biosynthesis protein ThiS